MIFLGLVFAFIGSVTFVVTIFNPNICAIASLILGVMGTPPLPMVGVIMGVKGLKSEKRKMAIAGLILSIIGSICGVIIIIQFVL